MPNKKVYRKKTSKPHVCNYEAGNRRFLFLPTQASSERYRVNQTIPALKLKYESSRNTLNSFFRLVYLLIRNSGRRGRKHA